MSDPWIDRLSEYLDGDLSALDRNAAAQHLEGCAECRTVLAELREVVGRAESLEDTPPPHDLWPGIARAAGIADPRRPARRWLAAASIVFAVLGGLYIARVTGVLGGPAAVFDRYILILHDDRAFWAAASPQERLRIVDEYRTWAGEMAAAGHLVGGEKLAAGEGRVLRADGERIDIALFDGAGPVIGGFFMIRAPSYEAAVELARDCPHLERGGWIELRRIDST